MRTMPRFFFPVDYDGFHHDDDRGEVFPTAKQAEDHAKIIAEELSRNHAKVVQVFVVAEDRSRVGKATRAGSETQFEESRLTQARRG
jgi:hypothetical protein